MKRLSVAVLVAAAVCLAAGPSIRADVKTQEKGLVKFEGMLGRMMNMFGGKAAKEGIVSNVAVKGDRKANLTENGGQIIDLTEEKVYDIDARKKTYKVTTFEEIRRQLREAQEKAAKEAKEEGGKQEPSQGGKEVEVDFDVKETGQKKDISGYNTREVVATITVREKGKTLEQSGGLVLTSDMWLAPTIAAMKEIQDFDIRYAKAIDVTGAAGASAEQLAAALAMYPGLQKALARMQTEGAKMQGTPLESVLTVQSVKSPEQMQQAQEQESSSGGGGLSGMLARKMMKKKQDQPASPKATIMTITHQVLSVSTSVSPADLQIPPDFKQKS
jgi:hypothetical protein